MLVLYNSSTSVCSIKVRLTLVEKKLTWSGKTLDLQRGDQHQPDYIKLNPNKVVPTLVHEGRIIIESTLIMEYLDDAFPMPPLMPPEPYRKAIARLWMKKIDDYLHAACSVISFATANRKALLNKTPGEREAHLRRIPNEDERERQRLAVAQGLAAPHVADAVLKYDKFIGEMETALSTAPHLAGADYSLADAAATPYLNRAEMVGLDVLWSGRQRVGAWMKSMRERPSFRVAVMDYLTEQDRDRFDIPRDEVRAKVLDILRR